MDTILGINNEGTLEFEPFVEWGDIKSSGGNVYNGQNQLFWQLFIELYGDKIAQTYKDMRAGNFNLEYLNEQYDEFQKAWGERLYNEDAEFSYIQPYLELGDESYFEMAQGMKTSQRHYFLKNRLDYLDSKFNAGNAIANVCTVRGYQANNLKVAYNMPIYASIKYGSQLVQDRVQTANTEIELPIPTGMTINDTETYIYSCDRLVSIDGLADYQIGYADFAKAINLQTLNIGKHNDPEYSNTHFNMLRLGNNKLLETLDCGGCTGLTGNIDVSGCSNLNTAYFNRTGITGITLPDGDTVKHIWLPNTLKQLKVVNQNIPDFNWNDGACAWNSLTQCWLENSTLQYDGMDIDIAYAIVNGDFQEGCYVRFIGYDYYLQNGTEATAFANTIASLHGIDERGQLVDNAVIDGDIYIEEPMSLTTYNNLVALMPYVTIHAEICPSIILNMETETRENNEDDPVVTTQSVELYSFADYEEPTIEEVDVPDLSQYRLKVSSLPTGFFYESNASTIKLDVDYLKYQSTSLTYGLQYSISTTNRHKYYYCMEIKTPVDAKLSVFSYVSSGNFNSVADTWQLIHLYTTSTSGSLTGYFDYITSTGSSPYIAEIRNLRIYDLTAQYGEGNEPTEEECVAQGCFLKKQGITGTTVTQEDIDTAVNVAQLMYPNGKQIIQDNINIYKHLNECNYNNLLEGYLGEPVFEDIVIDATQYRKKVSNISRNIMYCSQSTHREALIPNLTLDQMKAITVNDSRLANHVNYDDPTETVPKPMAFSITKTNVREYTTADSFDLSTLTDELILAEYLTKLWDFTTYDIRFDVYAIYNESIMQLLYGVDITKTAPEFILNDVLTWNENKILRTIAIFDGHTSSDQDYDSNKLYFVDLHDQDILAGLQQGNYTLNKNSEYVLDKFGTNSVTTWDTATIYYTSANYEGVILLYDKQDEDYACIRFVMPEYPSLPIEWLNYVFTLKQIFDSNNCQGWYLDKERYSIVNILQQTPLSQTYGYLFENSMQTVKPMFSNPLQVPRSSVTVQPLDFVAPLISGVMTSSKYYRLDTMLETVEILGMIPSESSILFGTKRAWIVPIETNQFSICAVTANSSSMVSTIGVYPIEEKLKPIIDIIGDIDYTIKIRNGEYTNIFNNGNANCYYYTSVPKGNKVEYFMGFSDIQAGNTNSTAQSESNKYTHCAIVDFALVMWNRSFSQDYDVLYAKKGFSTYSFDEDMPTFFDAVISSTKVPAIIPFKVELNYLGYDSGASNIPPSYVAHFIMDTNCDYAVLYTLTEPGSNQRKFNVNQGQLALIKFRLFNMLKQDFRKGQELMLYANSYQVKPVSPSQKNVGYGDGTGDLMTLVQIMHDTPSRTTVSLYTKSITVEMPTSVIFKLKNPNGEGFIDIDATNSIWVKSGVNTNLYMKLSNFLNWQEDYINGYNSNMHEAIITSTSITGDCLPMAQYGTNNYNYTAGYYIDIRGLKREYAENQDILSIINYWFPTDETKVDPNNTLIQFTFGNGRQSLPISGSNQSSSITHTVFTQHNISTSSLSFESKPNTFNSAGPCGKASTYYFIDSAKPSANSSVYYTPITADGFYLRICPYGEWGTNAPTALSDTLIETGMSYGLVFGVVDYTNWTIKKGIMYFTVYPSNNEKYGLRVMRSNSDTPEILYRFPTPQLQLTKLMDVFECANGTTSPKTSEVDTNWRSIYMCIPRTYICDEELRAMSPIQDYRGVEKLMNDEDGIYGNFSFGMWDDFKSLGDNNTYGLDSFNECTYEQFKSVFLM